MSPVMTDRRFERRGVRGGGNHCSVTYFYMVLLTECTGSKFVPSFSFLNFLPCNWMCLTWRRKRKPKSRKWSFRYGRKARRQGGRDREMGFSKTVGWEAEKKGQEALCFSEQGRQEAGQEFTCWMGKELMKLSSRQLLRILWSIQKGKAKQKCGTSAIRKENPEMQGGIYACLWHSNPSPPFSEHWFMKVRGLGFQTRNIAEKYP